MNGVFFFSENEIFSIEDIATEYNLAPNNPLLYALYIARNPDLEEEEKAHLNEYIDKLKKKQEKLNRYNKAYMERHLREIK